MTAPITPDLAAAGAAIATKYAAISGISGASTTNLDNLPSLPWVLVLSPTINPIERPPSHEYWFATYPAILFVDQTQGRDYAVAALIVLVPNVIVAWTDGLKLGQPLVQDSFLDNAAPDLVEVAGEQVYVYRFEHVVRFRFPVTRSA